MAQPNEASVEEILESIKKVIARDNRSIAAEARMRRERAAKVEDTPEPAAPEEAEEVLDLDESAMVADTDGDSLVGSEDVEPTGDTFGEDLDHDDDDSYDERSPLLNDSVSDAMRSNLAALAMLAQPPAAPQIVRSGETSLEGMVREMLRPMLAEWLDENLPPMVERMVQSEISRIAGKKR